MLVNKDARIPADLVQSLIRDRKKRGRRKRVQELTKPKEADDNWVLDVITDSEDEPPTKNPKGKSSARAPSLRRGRARAPLIRRARPTSEF